MSESSPRVLILSGVQGDTRRYRTHHLWEQLCLAGIKADLGHITELDILKRAEHADILIVHRLVLDRFTGRLLSSAERRGVPVILDVDDLVFDPRAFDHIDSPDLADPVRARLYKENMRRAGELLQRVSAVSASTEYLADRAREQGKPAAVHRNAFSLEMYSLSWSAFQHNREADDRRINILYASGTRTHDRDFALVRPALQRLMRSHAALHFTAAGPLYLGSDWEGLEPRVRALPLRPWRQLPELYHSADINLAPLVLDNPFSQSKSEIKYMEAGLLGVPTVASPSQAFDYAITDGTDGFLARGEDQWEEKLDRLAGDASLRKLMGDAAMSRILGSYSPWARAREALGALGGLLQETGGSDYGFRKREVLPPPNPQEARSTWSNPRAEAHPTLAERGLHTLRSRGPGTLAGEVWVWLRRLAAPLFPFNNRR